MKIDGLDIRSLHFAKDVAEELRRECGYSSKPYDRGYRDALTDVGRRLAATILQVAKKEVGELQ